MDNSQNYLLVTACKNEAENLPNLIESVVAQTIQPVVWVIVDDGSTDDTPRITRNAAEKYSWIHVLRLQEGKWDLGLHYSYVVKTGFDHVISYCKMQELDCKYFGNLDGDLIIPRNFYEQLINEFKTDVELGIASGGTCHLIGKQRVYAKVSVNEPSGGHMLIKKACFDSCGGIPHSHSIDAVLKAKSRLRGWKTKRFEENLVIEVRAARAAQGYWNGFLSDGKNYYYLHFNPIHVLIKVILFSFRTPYYGGLAFLLGYLGFALRKKECIDDEELRQYFWNKWKKHISFKS